MSSESFPPRRPGPDAGAVPKRAPSLLDDDGSSDFDKLSARRPVNPGVGGTPLLVSPQEAEPAVVTQPPAQSTGQATTQGAIAQPRFKLDPANVAPQSAGGGERKRLGEMLVDEGLITPEDLHKALQVHKAYNMKLGQYLIQRNLVDERNIVRLLAKQLRVEMFDPEEFPPDLSLSELVPEAISHKHLVVPLKRDGDMLMVGMMDPTDINAIDLIGKLSRLYVEPVICTEQEYVSYFYKIYGRMLEGIADVDFDIERPEGIEDSTVTISSLQYMAEDAPIIKLVNSTLVSALERRASDIHIQPKHDSAMMRFRVDGKLEEAPAPPKNFYLPFISRIKLLSNMDISVSRIPQDGRFTYRTRDREISVRTSTMPTIWGEKVVMRLLDQSGEAMGMEQLGLDAREQKIIETGLKRPYGMLLATGPTGSGKTTLLYALLKKLNNIDVNIVTLEDPVEYRLDEIAQIQLNRKAGMTFASGLRSVLRQDPDIIMVGEVRDLETADIAIRAALTGHKVLSTLHTNNAAETITRLIEMGIEPFLVASTLLVSVAQRLVRRVCTDCCEDMPATPAILKAMQVKTSENIMIKKPVGCPKCGRTGFKGRVGVYEILEIDQAVQDLILKRASSATIRNAAVEAGKLHTLKQNAAVKVLKGMTTIEEYMNVAFEH